MKSLCPDPDCIWLSRNTGGEQFCPRMPCPKVKGTLRNVTQRISKLRHKKKLSLSDMVELKALKKDRKALRAEVLKNEPRKRSGVSKKNGPG